MKRIGILTSGGDAPGMNAAIRSVVRCGIYCGLEVFGIMRGYYGLVNEDIHPMDLRSVSGIIQRGGTILYTARCDEFRTKEGLEKAAKTIKKNELDGLVVIGGDGSFKGAKDIADYCGIGVIGIPGTIDNDLAYTDFTLGFDTAVNTVVSLVNNIRDTMISHERVSMVEVMGRNCGNLALYAGLASGAEAILIPEIHTSVNELIDKVKESRERGKLSNIVIVSEGIGDYKSYIDAFSKELNISIKTTIIGHIQRGGSPTMVDRILASQFGYRAVQLLKDNISGKVVGIANNNIIDLDIKKALSLKREINKNLYELARIMAT